MKKIIINKLVFIVVFIVLVIPAQQTFGSEIKSNSSIDTIPNNFQVTVNSTINRIIESLYRYAKYNQDTLLGWEYTLNKTGYPPYYLYNGYQLGIAGIGDFLLSAYLTGFNNSFNLLMDVIHTLTTNYKTGKNDTIYWEQFNNIDSPGWVAFRYGSAGIIKFLCNVYQTFKVPNLDKILRDAGEWLVEQRDSGGGWIMDDIGVYITTDYEYGAIGVADAFLNLYTTLNGTFYLNYAKNILDWLFNTGHWDGTAFELAWTPQVDGTGYSETVFTGYSNGDAGFLDLLMRIYNLTKDDLYLKYANGVCQDLLNRGKGGYWPKSGVGYTIGVDERRSTGLVGYYTGASGIAKVLLEFYDITKNTEILNIAALAEKYILQYVEPDGSVIMGMQDTDLKFTGMRNGGAGVAYYFNYLYQRYNDSKYLSNVELITNHLISLYDEYGLIPTIENIPTQGCSLNYFEGLSGFGIMLLSLYGKIDYQMNDNYQSILSSIKPPTPSFFSSNLFIFVSIPLILGITIIYSFVKRK